MQALWRHGGAPAVPQMPEPTVSGCEAKLPTALMWAADQIGRIHFGVLDNEEIGRAHV